MKATMLGFKGKKISTRKLKKVWCSLTKKPFLYKKIRAFVLDNFEIEKFSNKLINSDCIIPFDDNGNIVPLFEKTEAFVFNEVCLDGTKGWCVIIKKNSFYSVEENLKHELNHIINNEVTLDGKFKKMEIITVKEWRKIRRRKEKKNDKKR